MVPANTIPAGLVDEVDDGARRVGAEQRRAAAPHDLHPLDVLVEAEQVVGVHEEGVHRGEHRHPVFHEHATYSTPRMPRMVMFSLTSPPELSTRVNPGT